LPRDHHPPRRKAKGPVTPPQPGPRLRSEATQPPPCLPSAQGPRWSPCARCAGTADAPTVIVCSFDGFPGGRWQIVTLSLPLQPPAQFATQLLPSRWKPSSHFTCFPCSQTSSSPQRLPHAPHVFRTLPLSPQALALAPHAFPFGWS